MAVLKVEFLFFVLLYVVAICVGRNIWDHDCSQTAVSPSKKDPPVVTINLNNVCENGTVDWHYPQGSLRLVYDKGDNSKFTFCMVKTWLDNHGPYTDLTDGRKARMAVPTKGHPSCISSSHGKVVVGVAAEETLYYTTFLKFTVL